MGSCASINKGEKNTIGYRQRIVTKAKRLFVSSPTKEIEQINGEKDPKLVAEFDSFSKRDSNFGSKDEIFFDSRAWLDSESEDDFMSVNGEFTPSRGSTPTHPKFSPKINDLSLNEKLDTKSEPSPRKKLSQLFEETLREPNLDENTKVEGPDVEETTNVEVPIKKDLKGDFNERTPVRERKKRERVMSYAGHCCIPGLVSTKPGMNPVSAQ